MRLLAVVAALGTLQGVGTSPAAAGSQSTAEQLVRIDVIPADARGRFLENLKPSDFSLSDDGVAQPLDAVQFIHASASDPRFVAIFLDEYHVSTHSTAVVRESVARFIEQALQPQDLLVVMKPLDSLFTIKLTTDREAAFRAVSSFEGRSGDYEPRNSYERNFMAGGPARLEQARSQVALSAINALAIHLAGFADRRKTLIVVSEGLSPGERRRGLEYLPTADTIVRSAQQANVSIYAVNPEMSTGDNDALRFLAAETMGRSSSQDLERSLRVAVDDASAYYLLTYRARRPDDGKFHDVRVEVKKSSVSVRARKGYFAPSPDAAFRAALLARLNEPKPAMPVEPAPHVSTLIRAWFGTARGVGSKTRVTLVWEPALRLTGDRHQRTPTRVMLTALAPDNSVLFEGPVYPSGPGQIDDSAAAPSRAVFEMLPGRLRLRMSIQDAAQQVLDSDVRSITIRDIGTGVAIASPEVLRGRSAHEFRALSSDLAVPVASREFSRTERLLIRFTTYGPTDVPLTVSARLLSRMGTMRALDVSSSSGRYEIDLSLAGLATGEYIVELSATSPAGGAKDVVDFRVTT
jgi:VWFA-related protein